MKQLHRKDLFGWSLFNEERNLDFHSVLWVRPEGNVLIDPLPLSAHDRRHLQALGGAKLIVITNFDHIRASWLIARENGAKLYGPAGDRDLISFPCDVWLEGNEDIVPGLTVFRMTGSKTPGELALLLENDTLITGDLIRSHVGGELCLLPDAKLQDKRQAIASVKRLAALPGIKTVLPGDGWPLFNNGGVALQRLAAALDG
ncbi:MBL fold metallo-hydrolase [Methylomicrobium sp. Wu6]|uniref:MBL fold metallo-hydrolase n=1 Tax=Methylomicrobium sp. Wu6 TaxID=3107928 RepID=UPI002DD65FDC|nr:MBL fold metallo-hydrolase [Methylomicrobium sp. Wu6]MEC4750170.1 MBL fold metallo-hydrolase [Methylomicrobium sp. Wu6]